MIGRERELEQLGEVLSRTREGRSGRPASSSQARRASGRPAWPTRPSPPRSSRALRGVAAEHGALVRTRPSPPCFAGSSAVIPSGLSECEAARRAPRRSPARSSALRPRHDGSRDAVRSRARRLRAHRRRVSPTVVVLDDLQWADAATLELLPSLAEAAEEWPLARPRRVSQTRRSRAATRCAGSGSTFAVRADSPSSSVEPLDPRRDRVGSQARLLGAEPGPALRAALYDRTQGVPFFVEELAAGAPSRTPPRCRGRAAWSSSEDSSVPIPETLRDALRVRVEGLSDEGRAALEAAAVIGARGRARAARGARLRRGPRRAPRSRPAPRDRTRHRRPSGTTSSGRRSTPIRTGRGAARSTASSPALLAGPRRRAEADRRPLARRRRAVACTAAARRGGAPFLRGPRLPRRRGEPDAPRSRSGPTAEDESGGSTCSQQLARCAQMCGELDGGRPRVGGGRRRTWRAAAAQRLAEAKRRLATVYELEGASPRRRPRRSRPPTPSRRPVRHADAAAELFLAVRGDLGRRAARCSPILDRALDSRPARGELGARVRAA